MSKLAYKQIGQNINIVIDKKVSTIRIVDKDTRDKLRSEMDKYIKLSPKSQKEPVGQKLFNNILKQINTKTESSKKEVENKKSEIKVEKKIVKNSIKNNKTKATKEDNLDKKLTTSQEEISKLKVELTELKKQKQPEVKQKSGDRGEGYR